VDPGIGREGGGRSQALLVAALLGSDLHRAFSLRVEPSVQSAL
jgi:hypothetical protein